MTTPSQLHELARQGNPKAISALLNQELKSDGLRSKTALKEGCLHVVLESDDSVPDRARCLDVVRVKVVNLEIEGVDRVRVYGRRSGEDKVDWNQEFAVAVGGYSNLLFSHSHGTTGSPEMDFPSPTPTPPPPKPKSQKPGSHIFVGVAIVVALILVTIGGFVLLQQFSNDSDTSNDTSDVEKRWFGYAAIADSNRRCSVCRFRRGCATADLENRENRPENNCPRLTTG
ncbi:hypothetical protein POG22_16765 [Geitlerinema sp. CS-897]|nr:hypothetical protein [Geitlerinema sp. CS-897]